MLIFMLTFVGVKILHTITLISDVRYKYFQKSIFIKNPNSDLRIASSLRSQIISSYNTVHEAGSIINHNVSQGVSIEPIG